LQLVELLEQVAHYTAQALLKMKKNTLTIGDSGYFIERCRTGASRQRNSIHSADGASGSSTFIAL